jgi:hypothetical protein
VNKSVVAKLLFQYISLIPSSQPSVRFVLFGSKCKRIGHLTCEDALILYIKIVYHSMMIYEYFDDKREAGLTTMEILI